MGRIFIISFYALHFCVFSAQCQEKTLSKLDSLEQHLQSLTDKSERAYTKCDIIKISYPNDSIKALTYLEETIDFFEAEKDSFGLGRAYRAYGDLQFNCGLNKAATGKYERSKEIFENLMARDSTPNLVKKWLHTMFNLSAAMGNLGMYQKEFNILLQIAPIAEKHKDFEMMAVINTNIGIASFNFKEFAKACQYLDGNDKIYEKTTIQPGQYAYDRLIYAYTLLKVDSIQKANSVLVRAKNILGQVPDAKEWAIYHQVKGISHRSVGDYDEALASFDESNKILDQKQISKFAIQLYKDYSNVYELTKDNEQAKHYTLKVLNLVKGNNIKSEAEALRKLAKLETEKHPSKALAYLNQYLLLNDSLRIDELAAQTAALEQKFQNERKERQIIELKNLNSMTALKLEQKKSDNYMLIILCGSLVSALGFSFLIVRNRKRKNQLHKKTHQKELVDLKNQQQKKLYGAMIDAVEQERHRLALDLHDGLGGRLASANMALMKLSEQGVYKTSTIKIEDIIGNLKCSLNELRGIARNLMPETLTRRGLQAAVQDYCSSLVENGPKIILQFYGSNTTYSKNKTLLIYRIIQEAITNAIKHAAASEILVQYSVVNNTVNLTVEDDGNGFLVSDHLEKEGLGLSNLNNRVSFLGGDVDINSGIGEGTSINIVIPLNHGA